ncbi:MAG: putative membrane protein insertion efficiency factor [Candidatus Paceibacteria bacterium]|jgi:putative membrane protein insertion efficiency factor|tara:strand:- start:4177 stop:4461 length:285 start_codon:yes stop_codon:yes gene_type:complete
MPKPTPVSISAKALIMLVKAYQYLLSPLLGSNCRYTPSCSSYTIEAIQLHGAAKGFLMGVWRILRCNPFSKGGYEPVPGSCEHAQMSAQDPSSK